MGDLISGAECLLGSRRIEQKISESEHSRFFFARKSNLWYYIYKGEEIMNISCPICLEIFTQNCEVSSTPCGHLFHSHCLTRSIETTNTCPQCRKSCAQQVQVHRVYLSSASEDKAWTRREKNLLQTFAEQGALDWYRSITERGENKNPSNQFGWTPLHSAAERGQISVCNFILESIKDDKNLKDEFGTTPLDVAARNGHLAI